MVIQKRNFNTHKRNDGRPIMSLTMRGVSEWTPSGREAMIAWLQQQIENVRSGATTKFSKVFTAKYFANKNPPRS